jgi:hypothetical protein
MEHKPSPGPQRGNALFLILIAVALFAALSYAITLSSRGSSGNAVNIGNAIVTAGQIVEMPAGIRQAVERMMITGTPASAITFTGAASHNDVFDLVSGGGGTANLPPPTGGCSPACTVWTYGTFTDSTHGLFIGGVKTDAPDVLAILPNVTEIVCEQIQKGLGFASQIPPVQDTAAFDWTDITGTISQAGGLKGSATTIWEASVSGQEFSCMDNRGTGNFYYHALIDQ